MYKYNEEQQLNNLRLLSHPSTLSSLRSAFVPTVTVSEVEMAMPRDLWSGQKGELRASHSTIPAFNNTNAQAVSDLSRASMTASNSLRVYGPEYCLLDSYQTSYAQKWWAMICA